MQYDTPAYKMNYSFLFVFNSIHELVGLGLFRPPLPLKISYKRKYMLISYCFDI